MAEELSKLLPSVTWFGMTSEATPKKTLLIDASLQRPRICPRAPGGERREPPRNWR
ncbi:hypothetical protein cgR_6060 [Corynebacterium glutamicum R]|uniref:Uncharacterized protein n=1 Tax=Corynebacterium glutamicum (strain R) TaxID=340322 RepID=A0AB72VFU9_CORGB|nr:hypothetical protein cgR_6060 [Corynebacterium glutamicum R]